MFTLLEGNDLLGVHVGRGGGLVEAVTGEETLITLIVLDDLQYIQTCTCIRYGPNGIFNATYMYTNTYNNVNIKSFNY